MKPGPRVVVAVVLLICALDLALYAAGSRQQASLRRVKPAKLGVPAALTGGRSQGPATNTNAGGDWPVFNHDPQRSGINPDETAISPATVGTLQRLWTQHLPELAGGSPILLSALPMPDGSTADLLFLTTSHGSTLALNAQSGAIVWQADTSGPEITNQRCQVCATPAADQSRLWIYAAGNDGAVHRYAAATGAEDRTPPWPVTLTLMNAYEKRSGSLNVANGMLYVPLSGYFGDFGPYVGHIVAIQLDTGQSRVFNVLCRDQHRLLASPSVVANSPASCTRREAGVWARAGVVVDQGGGATAGALFIATGNGPFDADRGGVDYGDSVLRLSPDAARLLDSYTPATYADLDARDIDLGSTAPTLLPSQAASTTPELAVQGGKDSILRLLDRAHLGGLGGEVQQIDLRAGRVMTAPLAWQEAQGNVAAGNTTWVFVVAERATIAFRVTTDPSGRTALSEAWRVTEGGTSPMLAGGVLFVAEPRGLVARDPHTGKSLWTSAQASAGGNIGAIHWQSPIVVHGRLYMPDENAQVTVYGLPGP